MTIIFTDGFDLADDVAACQRKGWAFAEGPGIQLTASKWGGRCWDLGTTANNVLQVQIATRDVQYKSVSFWRKYDTMPTGNSAVVLLMDTNPLGAPTASTSHAGVWTDAAAGTIGISNDRGTIISSVAGVIAEGVWQHWEFRVRVNTTTFGTMELWVDGIKVYENLATDTLDNITGGNWCFSGCIGATRSLIDDVVVQEDTVGPQPILGINRIQTLLADGAGVNSVWAGTEADVDDPFGNSDGDATFASSNTLNAKQDYSFADLPDVPTTIHAVSTTMEFRKDDAGLRGVTAYINSNGTEAAGAEHGGAEAFQGRQDIHALNPEGSVAWTAAAVNAIIAGHEITS